jgi:hypothetical protein
MWVPHPGLDETVDITNIHYFSVAPCRRTLGTATFSTPSGTPNLLRTGSKTSGASPRVPSSQPSLKEMHGKDRYSDRR